MLRDQPELPSGKIIAFRNRLIHGYWSVDLLLVRDVVREWVLEAKGRGHSPRGRAFRSEPIAPFVKPSRPCEARYRWSRFHRVLTVDF